MSHLEQQLKKIEKEVSNDLTLFKGISSKYYSVDDLKQLYVDWNIQLKHFDTYLIRNLLIGLSIPLLLLGTIVALIFKQTIIAKLLFMLIPIATIVFLGFSFWLKYRFESYGELEQTGVKINKAIKNKAK